MGDTSSKTLVELTRKTSTNASSVQSRHQQSFPEKTLAERQTDFASVELTRKILARRHTSSVQADISRFLLKRHWQKDRRIWQKTSEKL